jgi:hypothetical protein
MTFRLVYEITHDQDAPGQAARIVRLELECEPASEDEVREAVSVFLTAATGEREALYREGRHLAGDDGA